MIHRLFEADCSSAPMPNFHTGLRHLQYACARLDKLTDQQANDATFTTALKGLFAILYTCNEIKDVKPL